MAWKMSDDGTIAWERPSDDPILDAINEALPGKSYANRGNRPALFPAGVELVVGATMPAMDFPESEDEIQRWVKVHCIALAQHMRRTADELIAWVQIGGDPAEFQREGWP